MLASKAKAVIGVTDLRAPTSNLPCEAFALLEVVLHSIDMVFSWNYEMNL